MRVSGRNHDPRQATATLVALCLLSLVLTSCDLFGGNNIGPSALVKAPLKKQVYTIPEAGIADFDTLDPALVHDSAAGSVVQMLFTGLVAENNKLQVTPQLAQSWQLGTDGVTWTFRLRPHLTFSDGQPLTAQDVAYSIDRALQPTTQSTVAPLYLGLIRDEDQLQAGHRPSLIGDSILTPNATTVIIITSKKAAYFPEMLASPCSFVVEKSFVQHYGTKFTDHLNAGGGSGPFVIGQYAHGQTLTLIPNQHYYQARPQLQKVVFSFYHSTTEAYQAYKDGQVDSATVALDTYASDKKRTDFHQVAQLWTNYYTMNYLVKPFDNMHIRQAFALAIDKEAIVRDVWKGSVIATNHIVPQGIAGYNAQLRGPDGTQGLNGNPTRARALLQQGLQEEGWHDVTQMPPIVLTYATNVPTIEQEVHAMIAMWQKVLNITVQGNAVEYTTLLDKVTGSTQNARGLQFWGLAWVAEYADAQDWLSQQFGTNMPDNNMNYGLSTQNASPTQPQEQQVQQLLADADTNFQTTARMHIYQEAEQRIVNDVGWLPMEQVTANFLRTPSIVGIVDNAQEIIPPDDWAHIYRVQPGSN